MPSLSQRLREPLVLTIVVIALAGWLAFFAMWINSSGEAGRLRDEVGTLTSQRDEANRVLEAREQTDGSIEEATTQLAALEAQREETDTALQTTTAELETRRSELDTITQDLATRRQEASAFEEELASATAQTEELAARQSALQAEIQNSEQQFADVGTRLEEARRQEQTATANLAQITAEAATATASLAETQTELQAARGELSTSQQQLADATAQSEQAGTQLVQIQALLGELETQRTALETDIGNYQNQLATLQPQVEELTNTLEQRSSELANVERQITQNVPTVDLTDAPDVTPAAAGTVYSVSGEGQANGLGLTLNDDGTFEMRDRVNRTVTGAYTLAQDQLVLSDATGRLGNATFPMTCPIEQDDTGLSIGDSETCALSGLRFERVEAETP